MRSSASRRKPLVTAIFGIALAVGCGGPAPAPGSSEPSRVGTSAIQGGTADTTHAFAVGVAHATDGGADLCSGVLLAPNLVATARHCVASLGSAEVDCSSSVFGATLPASAIFVTTASTIGTHSFVRVTDIVVPSESSVCGNDIALLTLATAIQLPQYVTPTISPPMTDHQLYTTAVTAIGFGLDTPADGGGAGVRRIKENIKLVCIPNDSTPNLNCLTDQRWLQVGTLKEFAGGDGTCEGDSGSGAFEQSNFDKGRWVAFGVLSRGSTAAEGGTCVGSIYSRFDAWSKLIIDAANRAASIGGYSAPSWASAAPQTTAAQTGAPVACLKNGATCGIDGAASDCCSVNCISHDNVTYACAACDCDNPCDIGYNCQQGICVAGVPSTAVDVCAYASSGGHSTGCAVSPGESGLPAPWQRAAAFGAVALGIARRKRYTS